MRMTRITLLLAAFVAVPLTACGPTPQERCAGAKDVVTCTAVVNSGGDVKDYLVGGLAGAALASQLSGGSARPTVIHHAPRYDYRSAAYYGPSRTRTVTTKTRRSLFGGGTVTRTTTSYRPSHRSRR
ncbi:hypothetical protein [Sphingomonas sanguinis]|uniref:hypothetical protein n=1 Tax=Sphingomonas sanguinis TaxID=33051 RepID=UPI00077BCD04|nr:hypothetical protein [Sphingomonas sanguinis]